MSNAKSPEEIGRELFKMLMERDDEERLAPLVFGMLPADLMELAEKEARRRMAANVVPAFMHGVAVGILDAATKAGICKV